MVGGVVGSVGLEIGLDESPAFGLNTFANDPEESLGMSISTLPQPMLKRVRIRTVV